MTRQYEDEDDAGLDAMLRRRIASELDPQLGRARRAFEARLAGAPLRPAPVASTPRARSRVWVIGLAGAALAASIAALWAVPIVWPTGTTPLADNSPKVSQPAVPVPPSISVDRGAVVPVVAKWEQVSSAVSCVSQEKGVLLIANEVPARVVQQFETERMQYVCPTRGVRVEIVVPRQTTKLIALETH